MPFSPVFLKTRDHVTGTRNKWAGTFDSCHVCRLPDRGIQFSAYPPQRSRRTSRQKSRLSITHRIARWCAVMESSRALPTWDPIPNPKSAIATMARARNELGPMRLSVSERRLQAIPATALCQSQRIVPGPSGTPWQARNSWLSSFLGPTPYKLGHQAIACPAVAD